MGVLYSTVNTELTVQLLLSPDARKHMSRLEACIHLVVWFPDSSYWAGWERGEEGRLTRPNAVPRNFDSYEATNTYKFIFKTWSHFSTRHIHTKFCHDSHLLDIRVFLHQHWRQECSRGSVFASSYSFSLLSHPAHWEGFGNPDSQPLWLGTSWTLSLLSARLYSTPTCTSFSGSPVTGFTIS